VEIWFENQEGPAPIFLQRFDTDRDQFPGEKGLAHDKSLAVTRSPAFSRDFPREEPSPGNSDQALKLPPPV
jgi:hypothetical protein